MSQSYEMMYILRPDLSEEQVQQEISKYRDFIKEYQADDISIKNWGRRRLAYPIKKLNDGIYVQMNYTANGRQVAPLERAMRLSDEVIRYLTIKLAKGQPVVVASAVTEPVATPTSAPVAPVAPVATPTSVPVAPVAPVAPESVELEAPPAAEE